MLKDGFKSGLLLFAEIIWRSFGLFLKYLPVGLLAGGIMAFATKDVWTSLLGLVVAWVPALSEAYGEIGEEIAVTGRATKAGVNKGFRKAVRIIEAKEKELKEKSK